MDVSDSVDSLSEFKKTLMLRCSGNRSPGVLKWTVPVDAPDLLYYQVWFQKHVIFVENHNHVVNTIFISTHSVLHSQQPGLEDPHSRTGIYSEENSEYGIIKNAGFIKLDSDCNSIDCFD